LDLSELEVIAAQLLEEQKRHRQLRDELTRIRNELREKPRRDEKDKKFHTLIGVHWEQPRELEEKAKALTLEDEQLMKSTKGATDKIVDAFSSGALTVPLDLDAVKVGDRFHFRYRSNATFPNSVQALSELLGLPLPLTVDDVVVEADQIQVAEADPYYAKEKIVEAFDKIRKTVALKLATTRTRF
jgi:hypothetical protein